MNQILPSVSGLAKPNGAAAAVAVAAVVLAANSPRPGVADVVALAVPSSGVAVPSWGVAVPS